MEWEEMGDINGWTEAGWHPSPARCYLWELGPIPGSLWSSFSPPHFKGHESTSRLISPNGHRLQKGINMCLIRSQPSSTTWRWAHSKDIGRLGAKGQKTIPTQLSLFIAKVRINLTKSKGNSQLEGERWVQKSHVLCRSSEQSKHDLLTWPRDGVSLSGLPPLSPLCLESFNYVGYSLSGIGTLKS